METGVGIQQLWPLARPLIDRELEAAFKNSPARSHDFHISNKVKTRLILVTDRLGELRAFAVRSENWLNANSVGRTKLWVRSSASFCIGTIINANAIPSLEASYVGRIISGIGICTPRWRTSRTESVRSPLRLTLTAPPGIGMLPLTNALNDTL